MYKDLVTPLSEYNTPKYLFNYLHKHFKFKLDPCDSGNKWLGLPFNYTKENDGLKQDWLSNTFVNPPYGNINEVKWLNKCIDQHNEYGHSIFILLPSKTEATWFSRAINAATIIVFPQKRISFLRDGQAMNGNIMGSVIFGFVMTRDREGYETKDEWKQIDSFTSESMDLGIPCRGTEDGGYYFFPDRDVLKENYSY